MARQAELAMLDEMGIVTDTDPSEVTDSGMVHPVPVPDTEAPIEDEGYEEESVLEDPAEGPED